MRRISLIMGVAVVVAAIYVVWTFASRSAADRAAERALKARQAAGTYKDPYGIEGTAVKVLQFYASPGEVTAGGKALLCYGVANAKSVKIEPEIGTVSPSLNRCLEIHPKRETAYRLEVEGTDGDIASASFVMHVRRAPAATQPKAGPNITEFRIGGKQNDDGRTLYSLCYTAEGVEQVSVEPGALPPIHGPTGCFYVAPQQTTTYTLTAVDDKGRKAQKQVTVPGP